MPVGSYLQTQSGAVPFGKAQVSTITCSEAVLKLVISHLWEEEAG